MLTKEQLLNSLRELGNELETQGLHGEILLTGGAAMCLVHSARDMTKDIDALYEPKKEINHLAAQIAERNGLPNDWLNDSVKGFVGSNAPVEDFISMGGLRIQTVSTEYLLAMKLMAARYGEKDYADIRFLFDRLGIKTVEAGIDAVTAFFDKERILPKTRYVIEEIIDSLPQQIIPDVIISDDPAAAPHKLSIHERIEQGQTKQQYNRDTEQSEQERDDR